MCRDETEGVQADVLYLILYASVANRADEGVFFLDTTGVGARAALCITYIHEIEHGENYFLKTR